MQLGDILGNTVHRVQATAKSGSELVQESAVQATGKAAAVTSKSPASPALASAILVSAALGAIIVMRVVFKGAIS